MKPIHFIDRADGKVYLERVYFSRGIKLLYGDDLISRLIGIPVLHGLVKNSFFSRIYGWWQSLSTTKKKIDPFIKAYKIDVSEFARDPSTFTSFNDFFTRHLKPGARPITPGKEVAVIPADGRYYFYQNIHDCPGFIIKGMKFCIPSLLRDAELAKKYAHGSMVIARLCPADYHRFHFPCDGTPSPSRLINGRLYSVNPAALRKKPLIFTKNKRTICEIETESFGKVIYIDVGATCVGSIHQTYEPGKQCAKGDEKGYFSFGGSSLVLLFSPDVINFDQDLVEASKKHMEIYCQMGQSMGTATKLSG